MVVFWAEVGTSFLFLVPLSLFALLKCPFVLHANKLSEVLKKSYRYSGFYLPTSSLLTSKTYCLLPSGQTAKDDSTCNLPNSLYLWIAPICLSLCSLCHFFLGVFAIATHYQRKSEIARKKHMCPSTVCKCICTQLLTLFPFPGVSCSLTHFCFNIRSNCR